MNEEHENGKSYLWESCLGFLSFTASTVVPDDPPEGCVDFEFILASRLREGPASALMYLVT